MGDFEVAGWGPVPEEMKKFPRISVSGLCCMRESPAHYESRYILKEEEETDAMKLGTAIHMAVLEPDKFRERYMQHPGDPPSEVLDTVDQIKKALRDLGLSTAGNKPELVGRLRDSGADVMFFDGWWERITGGREVLKEKDWRAAHRIRARLADNTKLQFNIVNGEAEKLGWALHKRTQTIVTFKADYVRLFRKEMFGCGGVIADVKKVARGKTKKRRFEALIWDMKMFIQASAYVDILSAIYGVRMMFLWLPVEDAPPYPVAGYAADFGLLEAGKAEYNKALDDFRSCLELGRWPINGGELETVTLPTYAWEALEIDSNEEIA